MPMIPEWEVFYTRIKVNGFSGTLYRRPGGTKWKWRGNIFTAQSASEAINYLRENKISPKS